MQKRIEKNDVSRLKQTFPTLAWRDNSDVVVVVVVVVGLMLKVKFSISNGTVTLSLSQRHDF